MPIDTAEAIDTAVRAAMTAFSIELRDPALLRLGRATVLRARADRGDGAGTRDVIAKVFSPAHRHHFLRERAALRVCGDIPALADSVPRLLDDHDGALALLMEAVPRRDTLTQLLASRDTNGTTRALVAIAERLGSFHGHGRDAIAPYQALASPGSSPLPGATLRAAVPATLAFYARAAGADDDQVVALAAALAALAEEIDQRGPLTSLTHGDMSPGNILCGPSGPVFVDFEYAQVRHAFYDAMFWRLICPFPPAVADAMDAAYRAGLRQTGLELDDGAFRREQFHMASHRLYWVLSWNRGTLFAGDHDFVPGVGARSMLRRYLHEYLELGARALDDGTSAAAPAGASILVGAARQLAHALADLWPDSPPQGEFSCFDDPRGRQDDVVHGPGGATCVEKRDTLRGRGARHMQERIAVIGLGYVGLPVALAFARKFPGAIGFDVNKEKVEELRRGFDRNQEVPESVLKGSSLTLTSEVADLKSVTFFVVAVPTPVDNNNVPDLTPVVKASETVAKGLTKGAVVVFESTVYPGVTEEICGPILAKISGLTQGKDFKLGYSPERINPGDKEHTLERIVKVVSGEDAATLDRVADAYGAIIEAGVHRASSIKVAEAAKVIENTQRDLNIALMNELAIIFERLDIRTADVLEAAGTKWNFLKFRPGLVGGHCIGVDPYYLTMKAQQLGYQPEVILAGRRINNNVGPYLAQRLVKMLINQGVAVKGARVGVLGLTFKEDCNDLRNSKVPDILAELRQFGIQPLIHDSRGNPAEAKHEYDLTLNHLEEYKDLDGLIVAVSHKEYIQLGQTKLLGMLRDNGCFIDVKSVFSPAKMDRGIQYWSL